MTTMRFGVGLSTSAIPGADPVAEAQHAEQLGFDFVSASDHPCGTSPSFETWTLLTWVAARTSQIGVVSRVLGVPYRSPAMVAKMAASLDALSSGRLILGLGGGSSDEEFRAFGLTTPNARDKVDGLDEAVQIIRGLWSQPGFSFSGRIYHTDHADLEPKPDRRIPIWLGTYGPRALAATGRLADGWIPSLGFASPTQIPGMRERIVAAATDARRVPEAVPCAYNLAVHIDDVPPDAAEGLDVVAGPPGAVADRLISYTRLGFTAFNLMPRSTDRTEQVHRLATEVLPSVRSAT